MYSQLDLSSCVGLQLLVACLCFFLLSAFSLSSSLCSLSLSLFFSVLFLRHTLLLPLHSHSASVRSAVSPLAYQLGHGGLAHTVVARDELSRLGVDNGLKVLELTGLKSLLCARVRAQSVLVLKRAQT